MFESENLNPFNKGKEDDSVNEKREYINNNKERIKEELRNHAERLISEADQKIGKGNSAHVLIDPEEPSICYKVIHDGREVATPEEEAKLLEEVRNLGTGNVRVPEPISILTFDYESDGEALRCSAFAMERIHGMTVEEIEIQRRFPEGAEPRNKDDLKSMRSSFHEIQKLVERMNEEKGLYHNDLRNANIMLDEDNKWWLIDFGRAKREYFEEEIQKHDIQKIKATWKSFAEFLVPYVEGLQEDK